MKNLYSILITGLSAIAITACQPDKPKESGKTASLNAQASSISAKGETKNDGKVSELEEVELVSPLPEAEGTSSNESEISTIIDELESEQNAEEANEKAVNITSNPSEITENALEENQEEPILEN